MLSREERALQFQSKSEIKFGKGFVNFNLNDYINNSTKIKFTCILHNFEYYQTPANHLWGFNGCSKCVKDKISKRMSHTEESLRSLYYKVHKGYYTYDNYDFNNYVNWQSKIIITCPLHGNFSQESNSHIQGCRLS